MWTNESMSQINQDCLRPYQGFSGGSLVKNLPAVQEQQETWVWSLGQEDALKEEMATRSSILAWKIPWTEDFLSTRLSGQSMGLQSMGWAIVHEVSKEPDTTKATEQARIHSHTTLDTPDIVWLCLVWFFVPEVQKGAKVNVSGKGLLPPYPRAGQSQRGSGHLLSQAGCSPWGGLLNFAHSPAWCQSLALPSAPQLALLGHLTT